MLLSIGALGLGEVGHTVSTLIAGLCVPHGKYACCLGKVGKCCTLSLAKLCSHPSPRSPCALSFQVLILTDTFCQVGV